MTHVDKIAAKRIGRAVGALGLLAGAGLLTGAGCGAPESEGTLVEETGEARQRSVSAQACITVQRGVAGAVDDTHIANKLPPKNYGASWTMSAGLVAGQERQTLIKFDLAAIPAGANVLSADVTLLEFTNGGPDTVNVHRITAPWSESTETWQSFNGAYSPVVETSFSNAGPTVSFDVSSLVGDWVQGAHPNDGMLLEQTGSTTSTVFFTSESDDPTWHPKLDVCFDVTCAPGTADCNNDGLDGCETSLNTLSDCGGCGVVCPYACVSGVCQQLLLLSQIQTRGDNGGNDDFVEIYNPMNVPVVFDSTWTVSVRSALGNSCASNTTNQRFAGAGQTIPPHGHLLYANSIAYDGPTPADGTYGLGITDAASVLLLHNSAVVDAVCFYYDNNTHNNLLNCSTPYVCEGAPVSNLPHDNTTSISSNSDVSLERKPGGAGGNGTDTNVSANDFMSISPATPQNLSSPPAP